MTMKLIFMFLFKESHVAKIILLWRSETLERSKHRIKERKSFAKFKRSLKNNRSWLSPQFSFYFVALTISSVDSSKYFAFFIIAVPCSAVQSGSVQF